jgi:hypothetical protein
MTHFLFPSRRQLFQEARLLRMAPPPGEVSGAEAPPPAEAKGEKAPSTPDPKATFRMAQERMRFHGEKLKALQAKLKGLQSLQVKMDAGGTPTQQEFDAHGVEDGDENGKVDKTDVAAATKDVEAAMKPHLDGAAAAGAESDAQLSAIEAKGPGGQLDAAFMRMSATINDPNAGPGEKLAVLLQAFAQLQNVLKGIVSPTVAATEKGSPEKSSTSPQGKRETVRGMMKDAGKNSVAMLRSDKEAKLTVMKTQKGQLETAVTASKTALGNEQLALSNAKTALETDKENSVKQQAVRQAEARVTMAEGAVKAAEQQLASLNADIAKAEADLKTIKDVEDGAKKSLDDFNHERREMASALFVLLDGETSIFPSGRSRDRMMVVWNVLANTTPALAANGLDVSMTIANRLDFMKPFAQAGVDTKDLQINDDGTIQNPEAFLATVERLIKKVKEDDDRKKAEKGK